MQDKSLDAVRSCTAVGASAVLALVTACAGAPAPHQLQHAPPRLGLHGADPEGRPSHAGDVAWATYRETQTLDPIQGFDYPEHTVDPLLCDSLLRQQPDMSYTAPGSLRYTNPNPTEFDFTINANANFWDGSPVTAAGRRLQPQAAADPQGGGYYAGTFDRVKSFEVTGAKTFKILLTQPDYWLLGELSSTPGEIVEQKFAESKGKDFGTVSAGVMCSGPFKLDSWKTGKGVKMVPNPNYWDTSSAEAAAQQPDPDRRA